jgi:alkyl sulfatase BDS1-like metallo-beta-lactamase superfamily hydrolase
MKLQTLLVGAIASLFLYGCDMGGESTPVSPTTENPYHVEFSAPSYLKEHAKYIKEELFQIGDHKVWDYSAPNHGFGNIIMIEGDDGVIIIDTSISHDNAMVAHSEFRKLTDKPVKALIYTHHHADHINGAGAFIKRQDAENNKVQVIAAANFMRELGDENQATGPIMGLRANYMYGLSLDPEREGRDYHVSCCGYMAHSSSNSFIVPNTFIEGSQQLTIAGVTLQIFQTGGESASHLAVYLPEQKIMFSGDELQGPTYPNLHSLRGTKPRDAIKWITALDKMLAYDVDYLVPSHGQPIVTNDEVNKVLTVYRDSIQFTHDQSVRYINKGYTPDELANTIKLPKHLSIEPWTKEMYGTVKHNVREYYVAYISWWNGDPAELNPIPRVEKAQRMIKMMGGRDQVFNAAEQAFQSGDFQWTSELTALLVRVDNNDIAARHLKAAAFRAIGYATENTNWRGFYLSAALELEGEIEPKLIQQQIMSKLFKPSQLPTYQLLELLRYKIDAENIGDKHIKVAYRFTDTDENFTVEIRNSILQLHPKKLPKVDVTMTMSRSLLDAVFRREIDYATAIADGRVQVDGSVLALRSFSKAFDTSEANPYTSLR